MQKGLLYNMLLRLGKYFFLFPLFFIACDDLEDKPSIVPESNGDVFETGTAEMYILSEGLFNQNNSSLARYSFNRQRCTNNYFSANNQRGLGDTANDIAIYGNKIYVVVNVSSTVEVIDFPTGSGDRRDCHSRKKCRRYLRTKREIVCIQFRRTGLFGAGRRHYSISD